MVALPSLGALAVAPKHQHSFVHIGPLLAFLQQYTEQLQNAARIKRREGRSVRDQDHPLESIALIPPRASRCSLLLIGGMGPLAGVQALQQALRQWGEQRQIVLLQLSPIPDRTEALQEQRRLVGPSPICEIVTLTLAAGIRKGLTHFRQPRRPVNVVVSCNTAHTFLPAAIRALAHDQRQATVDQSLRLVSLVDSVASHLRACPPRCLLLAVTTGTKLGGVYAGALTEAGIPFVEPDEALQETLMTAIYDGVKAFNPCITLRSGEAFFAAVIEQVPGLDAILAGCTEVAEIINAVHARGQSAVADRVARARLIDPVHLALENLS